MQESNTKKLGRPKTKKDGDPTTPRQISYIVIGNKASADGLSFVCADEKFQTPAGISEEEQKKYTSQYVTDMYSDKGWTDVKIYGPHYDVKGLFKQIKIQSAIPSDADEIGKNLGSGEFEGWQGSVFEVKNRTDVYCFAFLKNVSASKNSSKKTGELEIVPVYTVKLTKT